jgi:hypothetical protein
MKAKPRKKNNKHLAYADKIQAAADYGIDVSLLLNNIRKTPAERIRQHQIALNTAEKLRKNKRL